MHLELKVFFFHKMAARKIPIRECIWKSFEKKFWESLKKFGKD
jgi:hypothetical protein